MKSTCNSHDIWMGYSSYSYHILMDGHHWQHKIRRIKISSLTFHSAYSIHESFASIFQNCLLYGCSIFFFFHFIRLTLVPVRIHVNCTVLSVILFVYFLFGFPCFSFNFPYFLFFFFSYWLLFFFLLLLSVHSALFYIFLAPSLNSVVSQSFDMLCYPSFWTVVCHQIFPILQF